MIKIGTAILFLSAVALAQDLTENDADGTIYVSDFYDSADHWYNVHDEDHVIDPLPGRKRYAPSDVREIADNILLYQKTNGGWPKNYDMLAVLTAEQKSRLAASKNLSNTTFDNRATHSQVEYLAKAYTLTKDRRYKEACLKGIKFILKAQYPNGGWPQFYPLRKDYSRYITFNDGVMTGVLRVLHHIVEGRPYYSFVEGALRERVDSAFDKGIECVLNCQIRENGRLTAWCQQHDNVTLEPRWARTFEPPSVCAFESSDIVMLLMNIDHPEKRVIASIQSAIRWFRDSRIYGIRVDSVPGSRASYRYHDADFDVVVVEDADAPPIWARYYEIGTNVPLFCNRGRHVVYSLDRVNRERRTGYKWYGYEPNRPLETYQAWEKNGRSPGKN